MGKSVKGTKTEKNILTAFCGESQARNRYTYFSSQARKEGYIQIADIFEVSRTLVRQALNQLSRDRLVTLEPARGARVAEPSVEEARQVFEVRNMLEAAMVRRLCAIVTPAQVAELRAHLS